MAIQEGIRMKGNVKTNNEWKERTGHGRVRVWGRGEAGWVILYSLCGGGGGGGGRGGEGEGGIMGV